MTICPALVMMFTLIVGTALITQSLTVTNTPLFAHRDGCHRWHSCPSDTGSYVCGDLGYDDECSDKKSDNKKEDKKSKSKSDKSTSKKEKSKSKSDNESTSKTNNLANATIALPSPTLLEGIELSGPVTNVVDGDTLDINGIRIRLALVNTPEEGQPGFDSAKKFVEDLCLFKNGEVDMDDGQRQGSFGREIGVVYCERTNLNQALMNNSLATIDASFCDVSEFADETWASGC